LAGANGVSREKRGYRRGGETRYSELKTTSHKGCSRMFESDKRTNFFTHSAAVTPINPSI
jgi:hypothetical protein